MKAITEEAGGANEGRVEAAKLRGFRSERGMFEGSAFLVAVVDGIGGRLEPASGGSATAISLANGRRLELAWETIEDRVPGRFSILQGVDAEKALAKAVLTALIDAL